MTAVCFYFQVHQPVRLKRFSLFADSIPDSLYERYFDDATNKAIFGKVTDKCYLPANSLLLKLIGENEGRFRISYSLTGSFLEQAKRFRPEVIDSFHALAETGCVEFLNETYYHSLSSLFEDKTEFVEQVRMHSQELHSLFKASGKVFRNTEALFSNDMARLAEDLGFDGIVGEGHESVLGWRSPDYLYGVKGCARIKALLRNYKLSDDVSYRFSARWWPEWPLTAEKYAKWLAGAPGQCINLFMDYETFGEHQWEETGIFSFLAALPREVLKYQHLGFMTPTEVVQDNPVMGEIDVPNPISWADMERDVSAWLGNSMQRECFHALQGLELKVRETRDPEILHVWRLLQNSDHLYYLCTKSWADGDVHKYFSPFQSPYEGFINYMNILQDFRKEVEEA
ncbi:MAG: glycoside hydrolase family 57 protein [Candidatus ainarchaeum sp.]|nr:glycoside hydrolase family 57 protein [Candidatus ainarchaeum sp.]